MFTRFVDASSDGPQAESQPTASGCQQLGYGDLLRLLSCLEGELQARDVVIDALKADRTAQLAVHARYGRLGFREPLAALQRDSQLCDPEQTGNNATDFAVTKIYESQLNQLEKLISSQRRAHERAKELLAMVEKRHMKTVKELEQERRRRKQDAAQDDDVYMMLEREREKLQKALLETQAQLDQAREAMQKAHAQLEMEKERHKEIVLYLLQERRQLMIRLAEMRVNSSPEAVESLKVQLDDCKRQLDEERSARNKLESTVKSQEEDLNLIRQTIIEKAKQCSVKGPAKAAGKRQSSSSADGCASKATNDRRWPPPPPSRTTDAEPPRYVAPKLVPNSVDEGKMKASYRQPPVHGLTVGQRILANAVAEQSYSMIPQHSSKRQPQLPTAYSVFRGSITAPPTHAPPSYNLVQQYSTVLKEQWTVNVSAQMSKNNKRQVVMPDRQNQGRTTATVAASNSVDGHQVCKFWPPITLQQTGNDQQSGTVGGEYVEPEIAQLEAVINSLILVSSASAEEQELRNALRADEITSAPSSSNGAPGVKHDGPDNVRAQPPPPPVPHKSPSLKIKRVALSSPSRALRDQNPPPPSARISGGQSESDPPSRIHRIQNQQKRPVRATQV